MKPPCYECDKKGCGIYHQECEPYQQYVAEKRKRVEEAYRQADINYFLLDKVKQAAIKQKKKWRRK